MVCASWCSCYQSSSVTLSHPTTSHRYVCNDLVHRNTYFLKTGQISKSIDRHTDYHIIDQALLRPQYINSVAHIYNSANCTNFGKVGVVPLYTIHVAKDHGANTSVRSVSSQVGPFLPLIGTVDRQSQHESTIARVNMGECSGHHCPVAPGLDAH